MNKYQEALDRMEEVYDNLDGCMSAMNIFKEGVNLLTELINEHFEEKQETNYEHYKDKIIDFCMSDLAISNGKVKMCSEIPCSECIFSEKNGACIGVPCIGTYKIKEWFNQPYKKPTYKLNKFEYDLINTFDRCKECCLLNEIECLKKLREKGYFNDIDPFTKVHEILDNCEVIQ